MISDVIRQIKLLKPIMISDVIRQIKQLNLTKSSGPDRIPIKYIKMSQML